MNEHTLIYCPRCSKPFQCNAESVSQCDCFAIHLSSGAMQYISDRYNACLCVQCLVELQANYKRASSVGNIK